jgi:ABC-type transporter Mla subunit MlaD
VRPGVGLQIRWGLGVAVAALAVILVLALVPDPFFRQQLYATTFDDVDALSPGAPVYFRGSKLGAIRKVTLTPQTRTFAVTLGVDRQWRPSACSFAKIVESNPFTTPRIELVALETTTQSCPAARLAAACQPLAAPSAAHSLVGCKRGPDLFETAALAIAQAAEVAKSANAMALQVQAMIPQGGGAGTGIDLDALIKDVTHTLKQIDQFSGRLNSQLTPNQGALAKGLDNMQKATDQISTVDIASLNVTLGKLQEMTTANQARIDTMLQEGAAISTQTRDLLENLSASLTATGSNLQRSTESLQALSEKLADDPTYIIRGQRYTDPPAPGAAKK